MNSYQVIALIIALIIIVVWPSRRTKPEVSKYGPPPHFGISQLTWDKWSALTSADRATFRRIILCQPTDDAALEKWNALSVNTRSAFRLLVEGGPMYATPPDVSKCARLRLTDPTPCRYPHCNCDMGDAMRCHYGSERDAR